MKKGLVIALIVLLISLYLVTLSLNKQNIMTVVVPHHNYVKEERLSFWKEVISKSKIIPERIEKVIVISPDHFGVRKKNITYSDKNWSTYDKDLENFFKRPSNFPDYYVLNNELVLKDHGIANLIGEIYNNFPNARFVPFIIGEEIEFSKLEILIDYIYAICNKNCILVTSVDFSHYQKLDDSLKQDERTISLLEKKEINEKSLNQTEAIEADSPASLYVMQEFARKNDFEWIFFNHTNSANGNKETIDVTTHIFGAYFKK